MRRYIALLLLVLIIISEANAADIRFILYEVKNQGGTVVATGSRDLSVITSACTPVKMTSSVTGAIVAGDNFTVSLRVQNFLTINTGFGIRTNDVRDPLQLFRGSESMPVTTTNRWPPIANLTVPSSVKAGTESIGSNEVKNYNDNQMSSNPYLAPGNYTIQFQIFAGSQTTDCILVTVPISNNVKYFQLKPEFFGLTNYNDVAYYDYNGVTGAWELYENLTLNVSTLNVPGKFNFVGGLGCSFYNHYGNGTLWGLKENGPNKGNCEGSNFAGAMVQSENTVQNYSCLLHNMTNTTIRDPNFCPNGPVGSRIECFVTFRNDTLGYFMTTYPTQFQMAQPLGMFCPLYGALPRADWNFQVDQPYPDTLFMVAGLQFNHTLLLTNHERGKRNLTYLDNPNVSYSVYDTSGAKLYLNHKSLIPNASFTLNVTPNDPPMSYGRARWKTPPLNLTINGFNNTLDAKVLPDTDPRFFVVHMYPNQKIVADANFDGQTHMVDWLQCPCDENYCDNSTSSGARLISTDLSLCDYTINLNITRLIYIEGQNRLIRLTVTAGNVFDFDFQAKNPFSVQNSFNIQSTPLQVVTPILISFNPNKPVVGPSFSYAPGSTPGIMTVVVPENTPINKIYRYKVTVTSVENPEVYDIATIEIKVVGQDVEVIAINKTPDHLIYNPYEIERVNISVLIKNNFPFQENTTLNVTVTSPLLEVKYIGCGGTNITLEGYQIKNIDCGAHANISDYELGNIVINADLGLLTGNDTMKYNNHKSDVITIVTPEERPIALPETNLPIFLTLLIGFLFARRKFGNKILIALFLLLLINYSSALTPSEFSERLNNLREINGGFVAQGMAPQNPAYNDDSSFRQLIDESSFEFKSAYDAKAAGDINSMNLHLKNLKFKMDILQNYFVSEINLTPLMDLGESEFTNAPADGFPEVIRPPTQLIGPEPSITVIVRANSTKKLIPSVSPEQFRGKKNIFLALLDILWDNSLMIGVFLVGILILYGLYHKDEEDSSYG
ncbi:hypothetical protein HY989_01345 [Candidatus Micrarchaeota archaeon]|nr:hypothetical protein [Candidatus Micrarchaeota archaeon]